MIQDSTSRIAVTDPEELDGGSADRKPRVVDSPADVVVNDLYINLSADFGHEVLLKCEGLNLAGSVKIKAARHMLAEATSKGDLHPGGKFVESSSGSLGVALAMLAASSGLEFTCVTDSRCNPVTADLMRLYGANVVVLTEPHPIHGLLGARIERIRMLLDRDPDLVWLNQYSNENNWRAHYRSTGPEIARDFPTADFVFIGAGTTGTLTGTARFLKETGHPAKIIAIDNVGSVTFGQPAGSRHIPGLGTGRRPEIVDESVVDELIMVPEAEAIRMCQKFLSRGLLLGGSTGSVLAAVDHRLTLEPTQRRAVAICPDFGERYLDTVYNADWVAQRFDLEDDPTEPFHVRLGNS